MPRTKVYKFNELSESAQRKAIGWYRNSTDIDTQSIYDEAYQSVKKFHEIFGTGTGNRSWLDFDMRGFDNDIEQLKGLRLRKYIWNNYHNELFRGKYYSSPGTWVEGKYHYAKRYSKIIMDNSCVLTGVCWDMELLQPIYDFINWTRPDYDSYQDIESLFVDCFQSLQSAIESECDYQYSDEAIIEAIQSNEYEFTIDGNIFR